MKPLTANTKEKYLAVLIECGLPYIVATRYQSISEIHGAFALEEDAVSIYETLLNSESWQDGAIINFYDGLNIISQHRWSNKKDAAGEVEGFICERGE